MFSYQAVVRNPQLHMYGRRRGGCDFLHFEALHPPDKLCLAPSCGTSRPRIVGEVTVLVSVVLYRTVRDQSIKRATSKEDRRRIGARDSGALMYEIAISVSCACG